jgi:hypothetical protein
MSSPTSGFNPARLNDQVEETLYAPTSDFGPGPRLKRERNDLIDWQRKKCKDDKSSLALAEKLETCKPKARCKSPACPECAYATKQWLTSIIKKYLVNKAKEAT